jgi:hypothetical protein
MEEIKEIQLLNSHILRITRDDYADSPKGWRFPEAFIVYDHRQFTVEHDDYKPRDIYDYLVEVSKPEKERDMNSVRDFSDFHIYVLYAYIHSGVRLSLGAGADRFDTSSTGYVLISKEDYPEGSDAIIQAENLIETWNTYLQGNVYQVEVIKLIPFKRMYLGEPRRYSDEVEYEEESIDSCSGFYGTDFSQMLEHIDDDLYNEEVIEKAKKL